MIKVKYFCDRCRKPMIPIVSKSSKIKWNHFIEKSNGYFENNNSECLLCEECTKDFEKWLKMQKNHFLRGHENDKK